MLNKYSKILLTICALSITGCGDESNVYTLYRSSPIDIDMRIHMATFDSNEPRPFFKQLIPLKLTA